MKAKAMSLIQYVLYEVTTYHNRRHNGYFSNTVQQMTIAPNRISVAIIKENETNSSFVINAENY